jgi:hypothetical protein
MQIMAIIYKFTPKKNKNKPYSQHFIEKVSAKKVTQFLMAQDPIITSTHLQLLLDEHGLDVPRTVDNSFDEYHNLNYLDHGSETIH